MISLISDMNIISISSTLSFIFLIIVSRKTRGDTLITIGNSKMLGLNKYSLPSVIALGREILFKSTLILRHITHTVKLSNFFLWFLKYDWMISLYLSLSGSLTICFVYNQIRKIFMFLCWTMFFLVLLHSFR